LPRKLSKYAEKDGEQRKRSRFPSMARAWQEYIRMPYRREPRPRKPASSQAKVLWVFMIKKFLLRGPIIVLICLAIGFAIVYGGEWLLQ
jgi:hypothetical protein